MRKYPPTQSHQLSSQGINEISIDYEASNKNAVSIKHIYESSLFLNFIHLRSNAINEGKKMQIVLLTFFNNDQSFSDLFHNFECHRIVWCV